MTTRMLGWLWLGLAWASLLGAAPPPNPNNEKIQIAVVGGTSFAPGRFETPAEVQAMARAGADLTSMNQATCAIYARQLGIRFASISSIANPASGVRPFTFKQMQDSVQRIAAFAIPVVLEVIARIPKEAMDPEPSSTGETTKGDYLHPEGEKKR